MGNKVNMPDASRHGSRVYEWKKGSYQNSERIIKIEIWACRLLHGSFSWIATGVTNALTFGTSDPIQHWWLRIQTDYAYYTIQKWSCGSISMQRNTNSWAANQCGLLCAGKKEDAERWIKKECSITDNFKTIGWFTERLQQLFDFGDYDFLNANCQDFALKAYEDIRDPKGRQPNRYPSALLGFIPLRGTKY